MVGRCTVFQVPFFGDVLGFGGCNHVEPRSILNQKWCIPNGVHWAIEVKSQVNFFGVSHRNLWNIILTLFHNNHLQKKINQIKPNIFPKVVILQTFTKHTSHHFPFFPPVVFVVSPSRKNRQLIALGPIHQNPSRPKRRDSKVWQ